MTSDPNERQSLLQPRNPGERSLSVPLTGEVLPPGYEPDGFGLDDYVPLEQPSPLRNPYVVAGLAIAGAIVLAVMVVILFGNGGGSGDGGSGNNGNNQQGIAIDPLTPVAPLGMAARSIATSTVREGPSSEYLELGTLRSGQDVDVVGRNNEATWFQIVFPPRSTLMGWVPASALRVPDDRVKTIPVVLATPIARPTIVQPTLPPAPTDTVGPSPTVTPTGTVAGGIDLAAGVVPGTCAAGKRLIVSVRNAGAGTLTARPITVLVQTSDGVQRALTSQTATLAPNQTIEIDTTYVVAERIFALVDPLNTLGDTNAGNNRVDCIVAVQTTPVPTRTPQAVTTPPSSSTQPASTAGPAVTPPPVATLTPTPPR